MDTRIYNHRIARMILNCMNAIGQPMAVVSTSQVDGQCTYILDERFSLEPAKIGRTGAHGYKLVDGWRVMAWGDGGKWLVYQNEHLSRAVACLAGLASRRLIDAALAESVSPYDDEYNDPGEEVA